MEESIAEHMLEISVAMSDLDSEGKSESGCNLNIYPAPVMPGSGGQIEFTGGEAIVFAPATSGTWELKAAGFGNSTPALYVYQNWAPIAVLDSYEGGDAALPINLTAGIEYLIYISFDDANAACTFSAAAG